MNNNDINEAIKFVADTTFAVGSFDIVTGTMFEVFFFAEEPDQDVFDRLNEIVTSAPDYDDVYECGHILDLVNADEFGQLRAAVTEGMIEQKKEMN